MGRAGIEPDRTRRRLCTCLPATSIREVARAMAQADMVAVTDPEGRPLGAVTGVALRDRVETGEVAPDAPWATVMTDGLPTLAPECDLGAALMAMLRGQASYLGTTGDGSPTCALEGIVNDRHLPIYRGDQPRATHPGHRGGRRCPGPGSRTSRHR